METKFNTHLYFIRDRLSKAAETAVIQSLDDNVAVRGFEAFLKADEIRRQENKMPSIAPIERELVHICALDENNHVLPSEGDFTQNSYRVVCTGDKVPSFLEEVRNKLRGDEDEEGVQN